MQESLSNILIKVNESLYLKDPETSPLGKKIISEGINLMDELGFDAFNFKKLAEKAGTTEASVYRYFENKHKLLLYVTAWYWSWLNYKVFFNTINVESPRERLTRALDILTTGVLRDNNFSHVDEVKLHKIIISESSKAYLVKEVDNINSEGAYWIYKELVARVSDIILEINADYKYPHMLISTVIEGSHSQRYFAEHLPRLTDVIQGEDAISNFYNEIVFKAIEK